MSKFEQVFDHKRDYLQIVQENEHSGAVYARIGEEKFHAPISIEMYEAVRVTGDYSHILHILDEMVEGNESN
jgi:hypothetical protein